MCIRKLLTAVLLTGPAIAAWCTEPEVRPTSPYGSFSLLAPHAPQLRGQWKKNLHASHTFFGPSAINMEQGQGYYQNSYVLVHSAWFAPLNNVSVGGGFQLVSLVNSFRENARPATVFVAVKGGAKVNSVMHVGVFAIGGQLTDKPPFLDTVDVDYKIGAFMAQFTLGTPDMHATFSAGWGATRLGLTEEPLFGLSGQIRVIDRLAIVTENWMLRFGREAFSIYTLGGRFLHRKLGADLGIVYNARLKDEFAPIIPYLGFALRF
jgi:hypothetical protein